MVGEIASVLDDSQMQHWNAIAEQVKQTYLPKLPDNMPKVNLWEIFVRVFTDTWQAIKNKSQTQIFKKGIRRVEIFDQCFQ